MEVCASLWLSKLPPYSAWVRERGINDSILGWAGNRVLGLLGVKEVGQHLLCLYCASTRSAKKLHLVGGPQALGGLPCLNIYLGSPGASALAPVWFPCGCAAQPAHLKVISVGSHFVLTFPCSDLQPCVTGQALDQLALPAPSHLIALPFHQSLPKTLWSAPDPRLTRTLFFPH